MPRRSIRPLIIRAIRDGAGTSPEISAALGLPVPKVSRTLHDMAAAKTIMPVGSDWRGHGRPARRWSLWT